MVSLRDYRDARREIRLRERPLLQVQTLPSELEVQARWFSGEFGREFSEINDGRNVRVLQFGEWNREAGPDFTNAVVQIDDGDLVKGCIEIDPRAADWENHGHAANPAYDNVVLHAALDAPERSIFIRTASHKNVPRIHLDPRRLSNAEAPEYLPARPGRCVAPLAEASPRLSREIFRAASELRLEEKARRFSSAAEAHGEDAALFQFTAECLGYKSNKMPFLLLAQRLPLKLLRGMKEEAEALLFGAANFLPSRSFEQHDAEGREYLRGLWQVWWRRRGEFGRCILPAELWKLSGHRPANHPQRRLAAMAVLARQWAAYKKAVQSEDARRIRKFFANLEHPFWSRHYTLRSKTAPRAFALAGEERVTELLANVLYPLWLQRKPELRYDFFKMKSRNLNRRVRTAAVRLFGAQNPLPKFLTEVWAQQALLQIYHDFCLADCSDCAHCRFPEQVSRWEGGEF